MDSKPPSGDLGYVNGGQKCLSGVGQIALFGPFEDLDRLGLRQLPMEDSEGQREKRWRFISPGALVLADHHCSKPPQSSRNSAYSRRKAVSSWVRGDGSLTSSIFWKPRISSRV